MARSAMTGVLVEGSSSLMNGLLELCIMEEAEARESGQARR